MGIYYKAHSVSSLVYTYLVGVMAFLGGMMSQLMSKLGGPAIAGALGSAAVYGGLTFLGQGERPAIMKELKATLPGYDDVLESVYLDVLVPLTDLFGASSLALDEAAATAAFRNVVQCTTRMVKDMGVVYALPPEFAFGFDFTVFERHKMAILHAIAYYFSVADVHCKKPDQVMTEALHPDLLMVGIPVDQQWRYALMDIYDYISQIPEHMTSEIMGKMTFGASKHLQDATAGMRSATVRGIMNMDSIPDVIEYARNNLALGH